MRRPCNVRDVRRRCAALVALAAFAALLVALPLHAAGSGRAPGAETRERAAIAGASESAGAAALATAALPHDPTHCPQCHALSQTRTALSAAPAAAPASVAAALPPRLDEAPPVPRAPWLANGRPRAPPAAPSVHAV